jgi:thiol-disulfide isomerase/thioredoxin
MVLITRRAALAAAGTLMAVVPLGKPLADPEVEMQDLSALKPADPPTAAPDVVFTTADGTEHHLSEFVGHGMVINLWATWCVPCVVEMPALAKLAVTLAPDDIAVMPLSSDRAGASAVRRFYDAHAIGGLPVLLDPKSAAAHALHARGIPTTVIIDRQGRERARLEGAADWATPEAAARVRALVG